MTLGFLHTADLHVPVFSALTEDLLPDRLHHHVVDEALLADVRRLGDADPGLRGRIAERLEELAARGAETVVCTCSSISGAASEIAAGSGITLVRIDEPLMAAAAAIGGRIGLVVAVESTVVASRQLLDDAIAAHGVRTGSGTGDVEVLEIVVPEAWDRFEQGDMDGYIAGLVDRIEQVVDQLDVVVLAQASMLSVVDAVNSSVPVLCAPELAVEAAR